MFDLSAKAALATGGSRSIGRAIALASVRMEETAGVTGCRDQALLLASEEAAYVSDQVLALDGGSVMH